MGATPCPRASLGDLRVALAAILAEHLTNYTVMVCVNTAQVPQLINIELFFLFPALKKNIHFLARAYIKVAETCALAEWLCSFGFIAGKCLRPRKFNLRR